MSRAISILTSILVEDQKEFEKHLKLLGFVSVSVFPAQKGKYLAVYFHNPAEIMKYRLRGVEYIFKADRASVYFYDLDQPWEDAEDIFGGKDY